MNVIDYIKEIKSFHVLIIVIIADIFFGILRAIKEKGFNSTIRY